MKSELDEIIRLLKEINNKLDGKINTRRSFLKDFFTGFFTVFVLIILVTVIYIIILNINLTPPLLNLISSIYYMVTHVIYMSIFSFPLLIIIIVFT